MKKCGKCQKLKDHTEFGTDKHRKDGLACYCKSCRVKGRGRSPLGSWSLRLVRRVPLDFPLPGRDPPDSSPGTLEILAGDPPDSSPGTLEILKKCPACLHVKPIKDFSKHRCRGDGRNVYCRTCAGKQAIKFRRKNPRESLLRSAELRTRLTGMEFDLSVEDIIIPDKCPFLRKRLGLIGSGDYAPSLDRIDNTKGYVKGNVQVISSRANRFKNNATHQELILMGRYARKLLK